MNRVLLDLGFIQIYWYSIMIILGVFVGMAFAYREVKRQNINEDFFINLVFYTIIFAVIGARLYYVVFNWDYYSKNFIEIFEIWNGGLAIHGGILFGTIFLVIYTKRFKMPVFKLMDICAVGLIIGQAIGRWGNFFNGEAYGAITTKAALLANHIPEFIADGMYINGNYYQPTFLYESIWNVVGFIVLLVVRKSFRYLKNGQLTGIYLMWYSVGRFFIEGMRGDSLMLGDFRVAQIISVILFVVGLIMFIYKLRKPRFEDLYREENQNEIAY